MDKEQFASGVWILVGAVISVVSVTYNLGTLSSPSSGFMPFLSGLAILIFSSFGFLQATLRRRQGEKWGGFFQNVLWKNSLTVLISLTAYTFLFVFLGYLISTFLFTLFLLGMLSSYRWFLILVISLLTAVSSYLLFVVLLKAQLPKGLFGI